MRWRRRMLRRQRASVPRREWFAWISYRRAIDDLAARGCIAIDPAFDLALRRGLGLPTD